MKPRVRKIKKMKQTTFDDYYKSVQIKKKGIKILLKGSCQE